MMIENFDNGQFKPFKLKIVTSRSSVFTREKFTKFK